MTQRKFVPLALFGVMLCTLLLSACGGGSSGTSAGGAAADSTTPAATTTATGATAATTDVTPMTPATVAAKTHRRRGSGSTVPSLDFSAATFSATPSAGSLQISVARSGASTSSLSTNFGTVDGSAVSGTDYTAVSGTLKWAAGDMTEKTFSVPISTGSTGGKSFTVALSSPINAVLAPPATANVQIAAAASGSSSGGTSSSSSSSSSSSGSSSGGTTSSSSGSSSGGTTSSSSGSSSGGTTTSTGTFSVRVSGGHLIDGTGKVVQLHGVNVSGLESVAILGWDPSNPWGAQTGDDTPNWNLIKTWNGAGTNVNNAVRLPLNEASWLGLTCVDEGGAGSVVSANGAQTNNKAGASVKADPGGNYQATVAKSVADATAAGLYVILDLHLNAPGSACPNAQNAMADADHSVAFWTSVATAFKGNPAVIFELFNEPYLSQAPLADDTPWADLLNGGGTLTQYVVSGSPATLNLTWKNAGMQQLMNAVRGTGATNVVLVAPLAYSSALDGWLQYKPTDPAGQMGAVWHAYPADGYPTQVSCVDTGAANSAGNLPGCSAKIMADAQAIVAAGFPVVITEYGDQIGGSTAPWASKLLPFADTNGISYLGWTWDTWTGFSADVLITDEKGTPTQGYGTYVKAHYTCVAAGTANCP